MGDDGWQDMPALMSSSTIQALSSSLTELASAQSRPFATVLHGGEPLMLGARRLEYLLGALRAVLPETHVICMQTNGMLLTPEVVEICAKFRVGVSISLDGPKAVNDRFRLGKHGESTHDRVVAGIKLLRDHPMSGVLYAGLLSVIDPFSDPAEVYEYFKGLSAPSVDFLYRDGNHSNLPFGKNAFESVEYGRWLSRLLDVYLADPLPPRIRFLDDIIKLCLGGRGIKEGLGDADYGIAIIETDGSVSKNDTLKSSFNGADRFVENWSVHHDRLSEIFASTEFAQYHALQRPTSKDCKNCKLEGVCGGGMPLHRWKVGSEFDNPSVYCNDQKELISNVIDRLKREGLQLDPRLR